MSTAPWWSNHPYADPMEIAKEQAKEKAEFIVAMNGAVTWTEYDNMTQIEINACIEALNKRAREANKK